MSENYQLPAEFDYWREVTICAIDYVHARKHGLHKDIEPTWDKLTEAVDLFFEDGPDDRAITKTATG